MMEKVDFKRTMRHLYEPSPEDLVQVDGPTTRLERRLLQLVVSRGGAAQASVMSGTARLPASSVLQGCVRSGGRAA